MTTAGWLSAALVALAMVVAHPVRQLPAVSHSRRPTSTRSRRWAQLTARVRRTDSRAAIVRAADSWSAQLSAGRPPSVALADALRGASPQWVMAARRIELGADPNRVLIDLSQKSEAHQGFSALAACWDVSAGVGGVLAETVRRTADSLRAERSVCDEVDAQLAAPKATARMVATLPLLGPALGVLVGADTLQVLTATPSGRMLLLTGLGLDLLGVWWVARILRRARLAS